MVGISGGEQEASRVFRGVRGRWWTMMGGGVSLVISVSQALFHWPPGGEITFGRYVLNVWFVGAVVAGFLALYLRIHEVAGEREKANRELADIRESIRFALSLTHVEPFVDLAGVNAQTADIQVVLYIGNASPYILSYEMIRLHVVLAEHTPPEESKFQTVTGFVRPTNDEMFRCTRVFNVPWPPPVRGSIEFEMHFGLAGEPLRFRWVKDMSVNLLQTMSGEHVVTSLNRKPEVYEPLGASP